MNEVNRTARPWVGYLIGAVGMALLALTCSGNIHAAGGGVGVAQRLEPPFPFPPPGPGPICQPPPSQKGPGFACDCWRFRGLDWAWLVCDAAQSTAQSTARPICDTGVPEWTVVVLYEDAIGGSGQRGRVKVYVCGESAAEARRDEINLSGFKLDDEGYVWVAAGAIRGFSLYVTP